MQEWHYDPTRDLDQPFLERLQKFPREPDMLVYGLRSVAACVLRSWLRVYHRLQVVHPEHLPQSGSFIMVANHGSHLDAPCLLASLPLGKLHRAFPAAAKDYFFESAPRALLSAIVVNALPFERKTNPQQSLSICRRLLDGTENILVIFPEGTRSENGEVGEFRAGIGLLVAGTEIPVVPCHLAGAGTAWPKGARFPRPHRVTLTVGPPLRFGHLKPGKDSALQVATDLRQAVCALAPAPVVPASHISA